MAPTPTPLDPSFAITPSPPPSPRTAPRQYASKLSGLLIAAGAHPTWLPGVAITSLSEQQHIQQVQYVGGGGGGQPGGNRTAAPAAGVVTQYSEALPMPVSSRFVGTAPHRAWHGLRVAVKRLTGLT